MSHLLKKQTGVDQALVAHYFGSKQQLFSAVVEPPFDPAVVLDRLHAAGQPGVGHRLAEFVVSIWESPDNRLMVTGLIRAAATEDQAAVLIRDLVTRRLLVPLAIRIGSDHPELRASLIASRVVELTTARHIIGLNPLLSAPNKLLVSSLASVFDYYLNGKLEELSRPNS